MRAKWHAIPIVAVAFLAVSMMFSSTGATPNVGSFPPVPPSTTLSSGTHLPSLRHAFGLSEAHHHSVVSVVPIPTRVPGSRRSATATSSGSGSGNTSADTSAGSTNDNALSEPSGHCYLGVWPKVTSADRIRPGAAAGVYLSEHGTSIKLAVTHPGKQSVHFSGSVTTNGTLEVTARWLEKQDQWHVSADGRTLTFDFDNHGRVDGIEITPVCGSYLTIRANLGNVPAPLQDVRIGGVADRSLATPLTITRSS